MNNNFIDISGEITKLFCYKTIIKHYSLEKFKLDGTLCSCQHHNSVIIAKNYYQNMIIIL